MDIIYHLVKWHPTANIEIGEKYTAVRYEYNGAFSAVLVFSVEPKKGFSIPTQGTFDELIKHYSK